MSLMNSLCWGPVWELLLWLYSWSHSWWLTLTPPSSVFVCCLSFTHLLCVSHRWFETLSLFLLGDGCLYSSNSSWAYQHEESHGKCETHMLSLLCPVGALQTSHICFSMILVMNPSQSCGCNSLRRFVVLDSVLLSLCLPCSLPNSTESLTLAPNSKLYRGSPHAFHITSESFIVICF